LRLDGIRSFIHSRGITLSDEKIAAIGQKKNKYYLVLLKERGPNVFEDAVNTLQRWKSEHLKLGLTSSSKNAKAVLSAAGIEALFDVVIDGNIMEKTKTPGKPASGIFTAAARALNVQPERAIV